MSLVRVRAVEHVTAAGRAWLEFDRRLGTEWRDLATAIGIPAHVEGRFVRGEEATGIRHWLERTDRLTDLPTALETIGRSDLIETVESALLDAARPGSVTHTFDDADARIPATRKSRDHELGVTSSTGGRPARLSDDPLPVSVASDGPSRGPWRRRRRVAWVSALCLVIITATVGTYLNRDHLRPESTASSKSTTSPTPTPTTTASDISSPAAVPPATVQASTPTRTRTPGATTPASSRGSAAPTGAISTPADRADVKTCAYFAGSATLPAGFTLILSKRNASNGSPQKYVEFVHQWDHPKVSWDWRGAQYFGTGNESAGQEYVIELIAVTLDAAHVANDSGDINVLASTGTVLASRRVNRVAGTAPDDPCEGS